LSTEEWTREGGTPTAVKRLVSYTDGSGTLVGGSAAGAFRQYWVEVSADLYEELLQYVILACSYETQMNSRPEKYISIFSDSQAAMKALQGTKSPLHWYNAHHSL
jgi:hypothetical protein